VARMAEYAEGAMAAYAVIARIGRVDPHLTVRDLEHDLDAGDGPGGLTTEDDVAIEVIRASEPGPIAERLLRMRELWTQTTFYLFDADSWRA
jgi:hypothetical protein